MEEHLIRIMKCNALLMLHLSAQGPNIAGRSSCDCSFRPSAGCRCPRASCACRRTGAGSVAARGAALRGRSFAGQRASVGPALHLLFWQS